MQKIRVLILCVAAVSGVRAGAQGCLTQAKMPAAQRDALADAALGVATAVQAGDAAKVRAAYAANIPVDGDATAYLVTSTAGRLAGASLRVVQLYVLDATARKDASGSAEFSCALTGSTGETDFSINGLPPGMFAFAMVEAGQGSGAGAQAWVLSMLLEQVAGAWKLAGLAGHARAIGGHDGLWYWNAARASVAAKKPWAAYVQFAAAYALLQPVNYVTTSHLDKLANEQKAAAPGELANGVSADTPYVLVGKGAEFRYTDLGAAGSDDGKRLLLTVHVKADSTADAGAARARNLAAAAALVDAHPELRGVVNNVTVLSDVAGQLPFATQYNMTEIP